MRNRVLKSAWMLAMCLPTLALAQQRGDGSWEFSAGGGVKVMDRPLLDFLSSGSAPTRFTTNTDPSRILPVAALRMGYNFTKNVGFSLGADGSTGSGVTYLTPFAALTLTQNLNAKFSPFMSVGSQLTRIIGTNSRLTHNTWGVHLGLGVRSMISDNVALRLEGRMATEHYALLPGKKSTYPGSATIGLSYFVHGKRPLIVTSPGEVEFRTRVDTAWRRDTVRAWITRVDTVPKLVYVTPESPDQLVLRVQFKTDVAELLPKSRPVLDTIAMAINETPGSRWEVQGHTDNVGSAAANKALAQARAQTVVDYLVSKGVDRSILTASGFGEARPVFSNKTVYGRAQNRRVQLRRIPPPPTGQPVP